MMDMMDVMMKVIGGARFVARGGDAPSALLCLCLCL
jgi:hypothetical protein